MTGRLLLRAVSSVALLAVVAVVAVAFTASNSVPATHAGQSARAIGTADLKPSACSALALTTTVVGTTGGAGNDLVLGGNAAESLRGHDGDDCILGGGGDDSLRGDFGTDVCIGGPGNDTFHPSCETQIQ